MASISSLKHICDRCGNSLEITVTGSNIYPRDWQHITLGQTGAELDLCNDCNAVLFNFMVGEGANGMEEALFNKREVL